MDVLQILADVLAGISVPLVMALCVAFARRAPQIDPETQTDILRYGWAIKSLALISLWGPIAGAVVLTQGGNNNREIWVFSICTALLTAMSASALPDAFRTRVVLLREGIMTYTPWRGVISMAWTDVREVKFSGGFRWFVVCGQNRRRIRVSIYLVGIPAFEEMVRQQLSPEQYRKAEYGFEFVNSGGWGP
jgi:hypothetical protein